MVETIISTIIQFWWLGYVFIAVILFLDFYNDYNAIDKNKKVK